MTQNKGFDLQKHVLVAPLDWGLGHATRCIPIIRALISRGCRVSIAGEGSVARLLQTEFPTLDLIPLRGYRVKYGSTGARLIVKLITQLPRLFKTIRNEHQWLKQVVMDHRIDAVISDNRFGLYHSSIPSVFITHQLTISTGRSGLFENMIRSFNYRFINRFTTCWVPDEQGSVNYAGKLSHPKKKPAIPVVYVGILSRLRPSTQPTIKNHLFVSLSGPEPQRSLFEEKLIDELSHYNFTATVVRGLPAEERRIPSTNSLKFYNHLPADAMQDEIAKADLIIARSGYSTVMDLIMMNKRSVLVPTPGQTEQEYIADYLMEQKLALTMKQRSFNLEGALRKASEFRYRFNDDAALKQDNTHEPPYGSMRLEAAIDAVLRGGGVTDKINLRV